MHVNPDSQPAEIRPQPTTPPDGQGLIDRGVVPSYRPAPPDVCGMVRRARPVAPERLNAVKMGLRVWEYNPKDKFFPTIPPELKALPQWVCHRPDKIPVNPKTGKNAKADASATWGTYPQAVKHCEAHKNNGIAGIGYEFSYYDPFCGIDLDHCRNPKTGKIEAWAWEIIKRFNSYTEVSPSGTGFHIIIRGAVPPGGNKKDDIEMYSHGRYFTVTGHHLPGTPTSIEDRQSELEALHTEIFGKPSPGPAPPVTAAGASVQISPTDLLPPEDSATPLSDSEIIAKISSARNGPKFLKLYRGDCSEFPSQSEAELAFCSMVAFYTQDPGQIDRIYRASALSRDKWDRPTAGSTYGAITINKALAGRTEFYTPAQAPEKKAKARPESEGETLPRVEDIAKKLNIPFTAIKLISGDTDKIVFCLPGCKELAFTIIELMNQNRFQARILTAYKDYPRSVPKEEWKPVVRSIVRAAQVLDCGAEGTESGILRNYLETYLRNWQPKKKQVVKYLDDWDGFRPLFLENRVLLSLNGFAQYLDTHDSEKTDRKRLAQNLRNLGCIPGQRKKINGVDYLFWEIPPKLVPPPPSHEDN